MKKRLILAAISWMVIALAQAAPLAKEALPEPLRTWLPWVMHGQETLACPAAYNGADSRVCAWPSELDLTLDGTGGRFTFQVAIFAAGSVLVLPGQADAWPVEVQANGRALPVLEIDGHPALRLPLGSHRLTGRFIWTKPPASLALPDETGVLHARFGGQPLAAPDAEGRLWLQSGRGEAAAADSVTIQVFRQIRDDVPMQVSTRLELAVAGRPRELLLPLALLPGFVAQGLESPLPARLDQDGKLRLQLRAGNWQVLVDGRLMAASNKLSLPEGGPAPEETWSFAARNDLRLVNVSGAVAVDPKQAGVPEAWTGLPAHRLLPGQALNLEQRRRGDPEPAPDKLTLARSLWLDFDGGGYTVQDRISGSLSRSSRLEVAAPVQLGRAAVDGVDQFVTRLNNDGSRGVEVRSGVANLVADSRIEGGPRSLPVSGWQADFSNVSTSLKLPPGWRLIHAAGADRAQGSWLSLWSLWDFFFVLLLTVAAFRLHGRRTAALFGVGLALSWHLADAPHAIWLALLAFTAIKRVTAAGRLGRYATWAERGALGLAAVILVPFAVNLVRISIYPSLEMAGGFLPSPMARAMLAEDKQSAEREKSVPMAAPAAAPAVESAAVVADVYSRSGPARVQSDSVPPPKPQVVAVDPSARIQTGPGLPDWSWHEHDLSWQGPVERDQQVQLWLLPPLATALVHGLLLGLLGASWWLLAGQPRRPGASPGSAGGKTLGGAGLALLLSLYSVQPQPVRAATPPAEGAALPVTAADAPVAPPLRLPSADILEQMRQKLSAPADCQPACADLARLWLLAQGSRVQLRAELHGATDVMVPLPGAAAQWRPDRVLLDGQPAVLRRDEAGVLWLHLPAGVHQVSLESDVGTAAGVQIALPLPPRQVQTSLSGWTLSGLDARGQASGALTLSRVASSTSKVADGGTSRDALPPFVRVVRQLQLGQRWTVQTRIERVGPSRAPLALRIPLLAGEAVTDGAVKVEAADSQRFALLTLAAGEDGGFSSSLPEKGPLRLSAASEPNQVEVWRLDASPLWHASFSGIAPVQRLQANRWLPQWQPWPGETALIEVVKPAGVEGQVLTLDRSELLVTPGIRASDVAANLVLRSSQGGSHRVQLPEGAQLLAVSINGQPQPIRAEGRLVSLPLVPGSQTLRLEWREPGGMSWWFRTSDFDAGLPGVNTTLQVALPQDRWLLALGGPVLGPALLIWGMVLVIGTLALLLGRSRLTPLGSGAWLLLGMGLAQASLASTALVAGFLLAVAARGRLGAALFQRPSRFLANTVQIVLALWALLAAVCLFDAIRTGLLGQPDMLVVGNGSSDFDLRWYADRSPGALPRAWLLTLPLMLWRLLMLAWALWLAAHVLQWLRWSWEMFSSGGYWQPAAPKAAGETPGRTLLGRKKAPAPPAGPPPDAEPGQEQGQERGPET